MIALLSGLEQDKYDIYVVSRSDGPLVNKVKECGWTHIPLDRMVREISFKDILTAWDFYKIVKKIKPDIVHTHSSKPGFIGRIIARLAGVPLIIHTINGLPFFLYSNPIKRFILTSLESFSAKFAHYNVFVNRYERNLAIEKLRFNPIKSPVIYNAISPYGRQKQEIATDCEQEARQGNLRNDKRPASDELKIVSVARFEVPKNTIFTVAQAIEVVKKHDNVLFTFYGDGEYFDICNELVNRDGVQDRVMLRGWHTDILNELLNHDVFLLNSLSEGMPISILEAMSVGLPIISSNVKGSNELVDKRNGWLINPLDKTAIEKTVKEILSDKSVLQEKGAESLKKVTNTFNYELFIREYKKIYKFGIRNSELGIKEK
jgi:glycosyltransferase involved in cell wall biosynthesis